MVVNGFTSNSSQIIWMYLDVICGPLMLKNLGFNPMLATRIWMAMVITLVSVLFVAGVAFVIFKYLSVITKMSWFPVLLFWKGQTISIAINDNYLVGENTRSLHCLVVVRRSIAQDWQSRTVAYKLLAIWIQLNSQINTPYVLCSPGISHYVWIMTKMQYASSYYRWYVFLCRNSYWWHPFEYTTGVV